MGTNSSHPSMYSSSRRYSGLCGGTEGILTPDLPCVAGALSGAAVPYKSISKHSIWVDSIWQVPTKVGDKADFQVS